MIRIHLDMTRCKGFGTCAELCPTLFRIDEFGYAQRLGDGSVPEAERARATAAMRQCGEAAIRIVDDIAAAPAPGAIDRKES